jgi:pimeloyl-ACP methyl ester carboxylesterase
MFMPIRRPAGFSHLAIGFAGLAILSGCAPEVTVRKCRPVCKPVASAPVQAELDAARASRHQPLVALGHTLTAAQLSAEALRSHPHDATARASYNFAVARSVEYFQKAGAQPREVPAPGGSYRISAKVNSRHIQEVKAFELIPADTLACGGAYFKQHVTVDGLGAALVAKEKTQNHNFRKDFSQERLYGPAAAIIRFNGRAAQIEYAASFETDKVTMDGHTYALSADFSAPLALGLAEDNPDKIALKRLFNPDRYSETARLTRVQFYDPNRIPVIFVHGLASSPATWAPMLNGLRADPELRKRYQFWVYSYPSGYPYPYSAMLFRKELDAVNRTFPGHKPVVLVGHSMGGMISRLMMTDSGDQLWRSFFGEDPAQTKFAGFSRSVLEGSLIFKHRPEVHRVVFIAAPHRGSDLATNWLGRLGSKLIHPPQFALQLRNAIISVITLDRSAMKLARIPNSVDTLSPSNRFVREVNKIPLTPGIPYHTIAGDRGRGDTPNSSDGVVPYWSSHLDGAQSELIVPSHHSAQQTPQAIAEVRRILLLNAGLSAKGQ